jgi:hypothetical protein
VILAPMPTAVASSSPDGAAGPAATAVVVPTHRQRYALLLVTCIVLLGVQGIAPPSDAQSIIVSVLAAASLQLALRAADVKPRVRIAAAALGVLVVALVVIGILAGGIGEGATRLMNAALVGIGPPVIALGVIRDLRLTGHVRIEALAGVLSLYLLLGMLFAFVYGAIDEIGDQPFFASGGNATVAHCVYFSFTTLTTVGYGDFTAAANLGRTLAVFEALLGQIYLVTVVSLIVTNIRRPVRPDRTTTPEGTP